MMMKIKFVGAVFVVILALTSCNETDVISVSGALQPDKNISYSVLENNKLVNYNQNINSSLTITCACLDECVNQQMCNWVKNRYNELIVKPLEKPLNLLSKQSIKVMTILDSGEYGCFSTFGEVDNSVVRIDVQFYKGEARISKQDYKVTSLSGFDLSAGTGDDMCIWKLEN